MSTAGAKKLAGDPDPSLDGQIAPKEKHRKKTYHNGVKVETMLRRATGHGLSKWQAARGSGLPFGKTNAQIAMTRRAEKA